MGELFYRSSVMMGKCVRRLCIRQTVLDRERAHPPAGGGLILACTHLSHVEPFLISEAVRRQVRWMARIEFYRWRLGAAILNLGGAFPIDRFGQSLPAVRTAIRLVDGGHLVGIFPEGGVVQGRLSVLRGAPIKQGVCTIAVATRAPVVPVVVLGTEKLNHIRPWLPIRSGRIWMAFGRDVLPPARGPSRRADRAEMAARLQAEFVRTYQHLLQETGLKDEQVP
jgi:1-acyl-sn-glycerol-3-phosphate acyltransferase